VLIQSLKKQLEEKDNLLNTNNKTQQQLQTAIDVLLKVEKANNRTMQELREKEKNYQPIIDDLTKRIKALEQLARGVDGEQKDVSVCMLERLTTSNGPITFRISKYIQHGLMSFYQLGLCRHIHQRHMIDAFNANFTSIQH
jgi:uncharacterized protein YjcR